MTKGFLTLLADYGLLIAWAVVIVVFAVLQPDTFPTLRNAQTILSSQTVLLVLTLSLVITLVAGEFDLSVAGVMSVSVVLLGDLNVNSGLSVAVAAGAAILVGAMAGAVNALFIVRYGVQSIIVTLGTGTILSGLAVAIDPTVISGISRVLVDAVRAKIFGLQAGFYFSVVLTTALWYVLSQTPLGRALRFVGASHEVAKLSGLPVGRYRSGALIAGSMTAALAGVIFAGTLGSADANISSSFLLPAFAAAFLGSTTVERGRFNAWGAFFAVYFVVTGITGLELSGYSGWIEQVFYGASLVIAVTVAQIADTGRDRRS